MHHPTDDASRCMFMNNIPTNMHAHVGGDEEGWTRWMNPSSPTLRNTAARTTDPAVLHSTCANGSQLCIGQQGNLLISPIIGISRVVLCVVSSCLAPVTWIKTVLLVGVLCLAW